MVQHDFDYDILHARGHRPWPMPSSPWVMSQTWHDLLFAHWAIDVAQLRPLVPDIFQLDLFDGAAWMGIVPFQMTNVAPRFIPALPGVSAFPELNVRTYVRMGDRPGVYFFSLDAASRLAVRAARAVLKLPYHVADMSVRPAGAGVTYRSVRRGGTGARFHADYEPTGQVFTAPPGTLDHFLTERYCLYNIGDATDVPIGCRSTIRPGDCSRPP